MKKPSPSKEGLGIIFGSPGETLNKTMLNLGPDTTKAALEAAMKGHIPAEAEITKRNKRRRDVLLFFRVTSLN
jgi:hypothetical protein